MKVYVAAPFTHKDEAIKVAEAVEALNHNITHKWWVVEHEDSRTPEEREAYLTEHAQLDFNGVVDADVVIMLHLAKSEGKAVEQGIALGLGIPILAIGQRGYSVAMNIFHWMPDYIWCDTLEDALIELGRM